MSRVLNSHPSVSEQTAKTVRDAMAALSFQPGRRPRSTGRAIASSRDARIAFVILGASTASRAPSFQRLLYGVSKAADDLRINLNVSYVAVAPGAAAKVLEHKADGLLLHGLEPDATTAHRLAALPTVWLMGNRTRPTWGDQVMPDNTAIGMLAAQYLLRRGHRRLAYLGLGGWSWSFGIRALAFSQIGQDAGATVNELTASAPADDYWGGDLPRAAGEMIDQLLALPDRPTGLFVSEDRLLPVVQVALAERQVPIVAPSLPPDQPREAGSIEIISCNNDARYLPLRGPVPPSIDIGAETIGRLGLEHLLWRVANRDRAERLRIMVAPTLIDVVNETTS